MSPDEYEGLVERQISGDYAAVAGATVTRNERVKGVRQPGMYEIDVGVRMKIADIEYFTIIECKLLSRKVDRPIIQKIIQTRDAIAAHKAIVVTNIGFSPEAEQVARANGVGLQIVGLEARMTVWGHSGPEDVYDIVIGGREAFAGLIGYSGDGEAEFKILNNEYCFADPFIEVARFIRGPASLAPTALHDNDLFAQAFVFGGSRVHEKYSSPMLNVRFAMCAFFNDLFAEALKSKKIRKEALAIVDAFIVASNEFRGQPMGRVRDMPDSVVAEIFADMALPLNSIALSKDYLRPWESEGRVVPALFDIAHSEHLKGPTIFM